MSQEAQGKILSHRYIYVSILEQIRKLDSGKKAESISHVFYATFKITP